MLDVQYSLVNDINCSDTVNWNSGLGFEPIGNNVDKFTGTFEGIGFKITGLYINRSSDDYIGLVGYGEYSIIRNVGLEGIYVKGNEYVGGLAGRSQGNITNSYTKGNIFATGGYSGGLVGQNYYGYIDNTQRQMYQEPVM